MSLALLAGCTMGPDYKRPDVNWPERFAPPAVEAGALTAETSALSSQPAGLGRLAASDGVLTEVDPSVAGDPAWLQKAWWLAFGDDQLDALVQAALEGNQDLRVASLRIQQFDAFLQVSRSAGLPQAGVDISRTRDTLSENRQIPLPFGVRPVDNAYSAAIGASWELDLWGRLSRADEAALANLQASIESRQAVAQSVVSELVLAYVRLLALDQQKVLLKEGLEGLRESVRLAEKRFANGGSSELPVLGAVAEYQARLAEVPAKEAQIAALENAINALLGRGPGPLVRGRKLSELALPAVPASLPSELLAQRPDLRQAEQELVAANARIGVAKAQYLPSISLTAASGFASNELSELTLLTSNFGSFGVRILGPIFSSGRIAGQVREAEALQQEAAARFLQALQTSLHEVQNALVGHAKLRQQLRLRELHMQTLDAQRALAQRRFEGGASDYSLVLNADQALISGRQLLNDAQRERATSLIAIYKAMGGGWALPEVTAALDRSTKTEHD